MRPFFLFQWRHRGRPWGRREAGWRRRLVRPATVREEEEGGRLGHEVSWADRDAEAQWGGGGDGQLERKKNGVRLGRKSGWAGWLLGRLGRK
jgi:hypothetical protein